MQSKQVCRSGKTSELGLTIAENVHAANIQKSSEAITYASTQLASTSSAKRQQSLGTIRLALCPPFEVKSLASNTNYIAEAAKTSQHCKNTAFCQPPTLYQPLSIAKHTNETPPKQR